MITLSVVVISTCEEVVSAADASQIFFSPCLGYKKRRSTDFTFMRLVLRITHLHMGGSETVALGT